MSKRSLLHAASPISLLHLCRTTTQALQIHAQLILQPKNPNHILKLLSFLLTLPSSLTPHALLLSSRLHHPFLPLLLRAHHPLLHPQLHALILKLNLLYHLTPSLVRSYHSLRDPVSARKVFDSGPGPPLGGVLSYNAMINGLVRNDCVLDSLELFSAMLVGVICPDEYTFAHVICGSTRLGLSAVRLLHQVVCKRRRDYLMSVVVSNVLVDAYVKSGSVVYAERVFRRSQSSGSDVALSCLIRGYVECGEIEVARELFEEMPQKDLVCWTAMVGGYVRVGMCKEALEVFERMEKEGIEADEVAVVAALSACAQLGDLDYGKKLHEYIVKKFFGFDNSVLVAALVDMYIKSGCIEKAFSIFEGVERGLRTNSIFNALILGLARRGFGEKAVEIFELMLSEGLSPDEITFTGVLHACVRGGLVEKGKAIFASMVDKYNVVPRVEHYGCMIGLLCQGGQLIHALKFADVMPIKATRSIWLILLNACKVRGNTKIGDIVRMRLDKLKHEHKEEPQILSSIYTDNEIREKNARKVRKLLDNICVQQSTKSCNIVRTEVPWSLCSIFSSIRTAKEAKDVRKLLNNVCVQQNTKSCNVVRTEVPRSLSSIFTSIRTGKEVKDVRKPLNASQVNMKTHDIVTSNSCKLKLKKKEKPPVLSSIFTCKKEARQARELKKPSNALTVLENQKLECCSIQAL